MRRLHPGARLRTLAVAVVLACCAASPAGAEDVRYRLGQGVDVGDLNLAGYANLVGGLPTAGGRRSLTADDLSLYVSGHFSRVANPFAEAELTGYSLLHSGGPGEPGEGGHAVLERLYNDSLLSDAVTLRLGKMLTPVGEWNEIHAAPLVWTTTRPLSTFKSFAEYTSGVSVLYSDPAGALPEVQAYWQPGHEIGPRPMPLAQRRYWQIAGLHVVWPTGLTDKVGLSFQRARIVDSDASQYLAGANIRRSFGPLTLEGEATFTKIDGHEADAVRSTEGGGYLLASYALTPRWSLLSWYEFFQTRDAPAPVQDVLAGVSYRPRPPLVWKLEYVQNVGSAVGTGTGLYTSLSVLF